MYIYQISIRVYKPVTTQNTHTLVVDLQFSKWLMTDLSLFELLITYVVIFVQGFKFILQNIVGRSVHQSS